MNVCYCDVFTNEPLHNVEIVNHQIEHDIDVEGPRGELANPMDLKIHRLANVWSQRDHRGIEALEMSHLENRVALLGGANHSIGFFERSRDWLLDQDVNPRLEQTTRDFAVRFSRHGNAGGVAEERSKT